MNKINAAHNTNEDMENRYKLNACMCCFIVHQRRMNYAAFKFYLDSLVTSPCLMDGYVWIV